MRVQSTLDLAGELIVAVDDAVASQEKHLVVASQERHLVVASRRDILLWQVRGDILLWEINQGKWCGNDII
ncbi:hypothetical protein V6N11_017456 [Hibiscus sabdariffa]|uniref:Uncharacterized protein n=1 Tax=Hibiscus sabdariffa TaxID=183260 RepID=A0ABR2TYL0_9ROSI